MYSLLAAKPPTSLHEHTRRNKATPLQVRMIFFCRRTWTGRTVRPKESERIGPEESFAPRLNVISAQASDVHSLLSNPHATREVRQHPGLPWIQSSVATLSNFSIAGRDEIRLRGRRNRERTPVVASMMRPSRMAMTRWAVPRHQEHGSP